MATGVGLAQISIAQLNSPIPITPSLVQEWRSYLPYKPSYCQFCVQIGCHSNKGRSGVNLKDTIRLPDPENPSLVQTACTYLQRCRSYSSSKLPYAVMQFFRFLGKNRENINFYYPNHVRNRNANRCVV